jgi:hypothetical protein
LISIPSSGLVAVSLVSKNVPHTLEVIFICMFYAVFIDVLAENFLILLYMEHRYESKEMKSVTRMLK